MADSQNRSQPASPTSRYAFIAIVAGALFVLVAILDLPGVWYAVIAVLVGVGYSLLALSRRGQTGGRDRNRNRNRR